MALVANATFTAGSPGDNLSTLTPELGSAWAKVGGLTGDIVRTDAGRIRSNSSGTSGYYIGGTPASNEYGARADLYCSTSGGYAHVGVRWDTATADGYIAGFSNGIWGIYAYKGGTLGAAFVSTSQTLTPGQTYAIELTVRNSGGNAVLTLYVDGVQKLTHTDASSPITRVGKGIVWAFQAATNTSGVHLDNYQINDLAGAGSFTVSPATIPANHAGNITLTLTGTGTSWDGTTVFTPSGVTGVTKVSQNVTSSTSATVVVTTGVTTGTLTITESVTGTATATTTVATATLAISPTSGSTGTTPTLTLTGTNTLWSSETAAGLFTVSGGTGASIATPTVTSNTAATAVLTVGSAAGTLTITGTSTGATATFTASTPATKNVIVFLGDSLTRGYGLAGIPDTSPVTAGSNTCPGQVMSALGTADWNGFNAGVDGNRIEQMTARFASDVTVHYNASATYNVCIIMGGTNNMSAAGGNESAATAYAKLLTLCSTARSAGFTVVVLPILPGAGVLGAGFNARRDAFNALLDTNWRSFADGYGTHHLDSRIGQAGDEQDTTYFNADDVHQTAAGASLVARYAAAGVGVALYPGGQATYSPAAMLMGL